MVLDETGELGVGHRIDGHHKSGDRDAALGQFIVVGVRVFAAQQSQAGRNGYHRRLDSLNDARYTTAAAGTDLEGLTHEAGIAHLGQDRRSRDAYAQVHGRLSHQPLQIDRRVQVVAQPKGHDGGLSPGFVLRQRSQPL